MSGVTFDDSSATTLSVGSLIRGATVRPEELLAGFGGRAARGTWTLEVFDLFAGNSGTVRSAGLSFGTASNTAATVVPTGALSQFAVVDLVTAGRADAIAKAHPYRS